MTESMETRVALVQHDISGLTEVIKRLELNTEKIGDIAGGVAKILAVHDERLQSAEEVQEELFLLAEKRRLETQSDIKDVHTKLENVETNLSRDIEATEGRIMLALDAIKQAAQDKESRRETDKESTDKRLKALENWRWMLVGGGVVLGFLMGKMPHLADLLATVPH